MKQPAIAMDRVGVIFGKKDVLSAFSLQVDAGEKVCLRGPSGSGKSTVLRCLLGLVVPREGEIQIGTETLTAQSVWRLRSHMAWAPQEPDWGGLTVREALERPFAYRVNRALAPSTSRIAESMERLDLSPTLLEQPTADLSGGEKQRLSLVAALLLDRSILLLDEVTSALDEANRQRVRETLTNLRDTTVLAVSHDAEAETWAQRVIAMEGDHA